MRLLLLLLFTLFLSIPEFVIGKIDSTRNQRFQKLVDNLHLKSPKLKEGEFEVRVWKKCGLCYGDAQMLYLLHKRQDQLSLFRYTINFDKQEFKNSLKLKPTLPITEDFWERLVQQDILTLPDQSVIQDKLHPKPQKDSTWNVVEADGSVSVKAKRKTQVNVFISDGEGYYFEILSAYNYREYGYSNPLGYFKYKPDIIELQKVVSILKELDGAFHSH